MSYNHGKNILKRNCDTFVKANGHLIYETMSVILPQPNCLSQTEQSFSLIPSPSC